MNWLRKEESDTLNKRSATGFYADIIVSGMRIKEYTEITSYLLMGSRLRVRKSLLFFFSFLSSLFLYMLRVNLVVFLII